MEAIVGDKLHDMMIDVMKGTPLGAHMSDKACQPRQKGAGRRKRRFDAIGQGLDKIDPNDPAVAQARAEWEEKYKDQIMADLKQFLNLARKASRSAEDLQKWWMPSKIQENTGRTEENDRRRKECENRESGCYKSAFHRYQRYRTGGQAEKRNARSITRTPGAITCITSICCIGRQPLFIKKPGIQPGSDEFAEAVYDMQEALVYACGRHSGRGHHQKFYDANGLKQDGVYTCRRCAEAKEKQEKADRKATEEAKKQIEAILKDPKVRRSPSAKLTRRETN